jgi:hypothetical protein
MFFSGLTSAFDNVGGLQILHGVYPALIAASGVSNFARIDGLIFCADLQVVK